MIALITGANSGIGLCYARELAKQGYDLVIVSNQEKEIHEVASELSFKYKVRCYAKYTDLTSEDACEKLYDWCKENKYEIDILINNAGVFFFNTIKETSIARIDTMLNLHVRVTTKLCKLFSSDMILRKKGWILNMSSMSAWVCFPGISTYSATKAYILSFSKAMWYELKPYNVSVLAVCPGAVDTGLYGLSSYWRKVAVNIGVSMSPEKMVEKAIRKMFSGKKQYLPGFINHLFIPVLKHLPDCMVFVIIKKIKQFQK